LFGARLFPIFTYTIGVILGMARPSDDGWDPGDRLRILQYKNSEFVPRIVMGDAAKNVSKEVKKHHGEIDWKGLAGMRDKLEKTPREAK